MALSIEQITADVLSTLTRQELDSSAIYLDLTELKVGSTVEVDRKPVQVPFDSIMAFIDLKPAANWGHPCRYLLVNRADGAKRSFEGSYPPFLKGARPTLRLIWKGSNVPGWALAVSQ
jgi:hypothetical protein